MSRVTVVIPVYNRPHELERAISSVAKQTYDDYEIIVVDDASEDRILPVVESFESEDITYIRHTKNKGGAAARNTGIDQADGEYIAFLDSDDIWLPEKLSKQVSVFKSSDSGLGAVYTGTTIVRDGEEYTGRIPDARGDIFFGQLFEDQVSPTSAVMVRKLCFNQVGLFDATLPARQDYDMWIRIARNYRFDYVDEPLVKLHRDGQDRISADINDRIAGHKRVLEKIQDDIEELPVLTQRRIYASHYQSLAKHAFLHGHRLETLRWSLRSIASFPGYTRPWALSAAALLNVNPSSKYLQKSIDVLKQING